jgi:hypothetical protein
MMDGRQINDASPGYPYSETGFKTGPGSFSQYRFTPGEVSNMYMNREARFYASVGFSECFWPCESTATAGNYNLTVTYYFDARNGKSSVSSPTNYPITGYVIKKFVHPVDAWNGVKMHGDRRKRLQ